MKAYIKHILTFLRANLKSLLLSLVLSVIIWFAVSIQVFPNVYDHVSDIEVIAAPTALMEQENLEITKINSETVTVQIQGKRYVIGSLSAADFTAVLDLSMVTTPGTHVVPIDVAPIVNSDDYEIVSSGLTTTIDVQRVITKEIPVEVNTDNIQIAEGLHVQTDEITISPSTVTVKGEESLVNSIEKAVVDVDYNKVMSVTTELKGELSLYKSDNTKIENPDLKYEKTGYIVTVPVCKVKTLPLDFSLNVPSNFDISSLPYTILPEEITIAAPATDTSIDNLEKTDIGEINLSNLTSKDPQGVKLVISLPDGYKNLSNIGIAQVNFDNADSYGKLEFTVPTDDFSILNGDEAFEYSMVTNQLAVTVVGPSDVLHNMISSDITGTVNLLGVTMEEGVKNVTVSLRINGIDVSAWVTGDYKVDIRATAKEAVE